jgi:hypothetical protein
MRGCITYPFATSANLRIRVDGLGKRLQEAFTLQTGKARREALSKKSSLSSRNFEATRLLLAQTKNLHRSGFQVSSIDLPAARLPQARNVALAFLQPTSAMTPVAASRSGLRQVLAFGSVIAGILITPLWAGLIGWAIVDLLW